MLLSRCFISRPFTNGRGKVFTHKFLHSISQNTSQGHQFYNALRIADMKQQQAAADRKRRKTDHGDVQLREGSNEEVLSFEVQALLDQHAKEVSVPESADGYLNVPETNGAEDEEADQFAEIEVEISELSSTGDGLALSPSGNLVYVVPFSVPGDRVLAKVVEHHRFKPYARADFTKVIKPSEKRNDAGIGCKYFSTCSGCQLQMLSYDDQLAHKKTILEKAYRNFSGLNPFLIPPVSDTYGSPLEYNYRTKLTPHFDAAKGPKGHKVFTEVPPIGFTKKGRKKSWISKTVPSAAP